MFLLNDSCLTTMASATSLTSQIRASNPPTYLHSGCSAHVYLDCSLTAILISRFLLDLQEANKHTVRLDADEPLSSIDSVGSLSFVARTMGSLQSTIMPGHSGDDNYSQTEVAHESSVALEELPDREIKGPIHVEA